LTSKSPNMAWNRVWTELKKFSKPSLLSTNPPGRSAASELPKAQVINAVIKTNGRASEIADVIIRTKGPVALNG